jgi:hypothetical protein
VVVLGFLSCQEISTSGAKLVQIALVQTCGIVYFKKAPVHFYFVDVTLHA